MSLEPCPEYFDLGPFRFECDGHTAHARENALRYHGGKLTHHATSPQEVGDVDVTFWTMVWDPDHPVTQGHKYLGSDGGWHLSECLLVAYTGTGYHCTCRDDSPDWDRG